MTETKSNNKKITLYANDFPNYQHSQKTPFLSYLKDKVYPVIEEKDAEAAKSFYSCINNYDYLSEKYNAHYVCPKVALHLTYAVYKFQSGTDFLSMQYMPYLFGTYFACKIAYSIAEQVENTFLCSCVDSYIDSHMLGNVCGDLSINISNIGNFLFG